MWLARLGGGFILGSVTVLAFARGIPSMAPIHATLLSGTAILSTTLAIISYHTRWSHFLTWCDRHGEDADLRQYFAETIGVSLLPVGVMAYAGFAATLAAFMAP